MAAAMATASAPASAPATGADMTRRDDQMRGLRAMPHRAVWCDDAPVTVHPDRLIESKRQSRFTVEDKADATALWLAVVAGIVAACIAAWLALEIYGAVVGRVTTELAVTPEMAIAMMEEQQ